jgi:TonB family protein
MMKRTFFLILLVLIVPVSFAQFGQVDTSATIVDTVVSKVDTIRVDTTTAQYLKYKAAKDSADKEIIYEGAHHSAEFPGGGPAFRYFLEKNMMYPPAAKANKIQGKVYVTFVVDKKGVIKYPKIQKSLGYGCDEEAIRLVKKMPKWEPGIWYDDQPIHTRVTMAIPFTLPK